MVGHSPAAPYDFSRPSQLVLVAFCLHRYAFEQWFRSLDQKEQVVDPSDFACAYKANNYTKREQAQENPKEEKGAKGKKNKKCLI